MSIDHGDRSPAVRLESDDDRDSVLVVETPAGPFQLDELGPLIGAIEPICGCPVAVATWLDAPSD